jgi:hypothetical protein
LESNHLGGNVDFFDILSWVKDPYPFFLELLPRDLGKNLKDPSSSINTINLGDDKEDSLDTTKEGALEVYKYNLHPRKSVGMRI